MPRPRRLLPAGFLVLAIGVAACGGAPDAATVARDARSWAASSALIGERWRAATVPNAYAHRSLDAAGASLSQTAQSAAGLPDTARARASLIARIRMVRQSVTMLDSAVVHGDRAATMRPVGALAIDRHVLDSLARSAGASQ